MVTKALFEGLVFDEYNRSVEVTYIGSEPCYVVDDEGFLRHVPTEHVDRQVLEKMREMIQGHEDLLAEQAAKLMGQDDIFSRAMIETQLKDIDKQFSAVLEAGIPEPTRAYMGMMGFRIIIDIHGDVTNIEQPGMVDSGDE